jgi:hypothetical protein
MWIMTLDGFFSVVQKPRQRETAMLTVRGRSRDDLVRLTRRLKIQRKIYQAWESQDYEWRIMLRKEQWAKYLALMAQSIEYDNFKHEIALMDPERSAVYSRIWGILHGISDRPKLQSTGKAVTFKGRKGGKTFASDMSRKYPDIFQTDIFERG